MKFKLEHTDKNSMARAGTIETDHGSIHTPIFMPVGTQASVKALSVSDLNNSGAEIILANTYHLYLRPGTVTIRSIGGVQRFNSWNKPMLTDSGGFQVFSLSDLRKISEEGVAFKSHIDGSAHLFTPENVVDIQREIGADIIMLLDECPPGDSDYDYVRQSNDLTIRWAKRGLDRFHSTKPIYDFEQSQFAIVQGGVFEDIRKSSAQALIEMDFDGYAIGGLSVGESKEDMYRITAFTAPLLPREKPRYLMGVGKPEDILYAIECGIDMFDCVLPTRNARNATLYTSQGKVNIKNSKYREDKSPLDPSCACETCQTYSSAYLQHLYKANELLFYKLASLHNITFYMTMVKTAREAILNDIYLDWKKNFLLYQ
ncbi:MAG: tRNA guanosine(34) transglycosylase Tgt [Calditrichaeota bacterium]|nr:tRNA guanosine(34) transglycosylase Tgt [Calditrichota bacterium]